MYKRQIIRINERICERIDERAYSGVSIHIITLHTMNMCDEARRVGVDVSDIIVEELEREEKQDA